MILANEGYRTLSARNGEEALVVCRAERPCLMITDLLMPVMDGYELVRRLRAESDIAGTRVIFFTGTFKASEAQSLAQQCGVQQVLRKPSTAAVILRSVALALSTPPPLDTHPDLNFDRQHARLLSEMLLKNTDQLANVSSRLAASELEYREMFEGHPEPMWVLDATLGFLSVNEAAVLHYGYTRDEFLAKSLFDILPQDEVMTAIAAFQKTESWRASSQGACRHYRKDGVLIEVELTAHKLKFAGRAAYSVLVHDVTERNRYERSLRESEEQLRTLAGRLQQVREEERAFLARELHDDFGQSLTAIKMNVSWLAAHPGATAQAIEARILATIDLADLTICAARRLASDLRPGVLDLGLQAAIEWQVAEFKYQSEIRCELEFPAGKIPLNAGQEVTLFRIFQETLTNVARHSGASLVTTKLSVEGGYVTLMVQDNGCGITSTEMAKRSSLGLLGMRERVLSLGGSIEIEGTNGVGTLVRVNVPVAHTAA